MLPDRYDVLYARARQPRRRGIHAECALRSRVYDCVRANPGLHLRALQRLLSVPLGSVAYHLARLNRQGRIAARVFYRYKAFFATDHLDRSDRDHLCYLRQPQPGRILAEASRHKEIGFQELLKHVPVRASTLSFHLGHLVGASLIRVEPRGASRTYAVLDPARVQRLLATYACAANWVQSVASRPRPRPTLNAPGVLVPAVPTAAPRLDFVS